MGKREGMRKLGENETAAERRKGRKGKEEKRKTRKRKVIKKWMRE